jgi:hypothetical protein
MIPKAVLVNGLKFLCKFFITTNLGIAEGIQTVIQTLV